MRGKDVKDIVIKAVEDLEGARGGGHQDAVGGQVQLEDLEKFKERVKELVG